MRFSGISESTIRDNVLEIENVTYGKVRIFPVREVELWLYDNTQKLYKLFDKPAN